MNISGLLLKFRLPMGGKEILMGSKGSGKDEER